jgi:hypothetical protein
MGPIMKSDTARDLITFATLVRANISPLSNETTTLNLTKDITPQLQQLNTYSSGPSLLAEQNNSDVAEIDRSDVMPSSEGKKLILHPEHPTFVIVIGMLPKVMFWATVALLAKYSSGVYAALVRNVKDSKLWDSLADWLWNGVCDESIHE